MSQMVLYFFTKYFSTLILHRHNLATFYSCIASYLRIEVLLVVVVEILTYKIKGPTYGTNLMQARLQRLIIMKEKCQLTIRVDKPNEICI